MLNLERLRVLYAVATTGSVVGAARTLHVTTSAISQQMARLERDVGQRLVERQGRGIRLTEAGELLARGAADLMVQVEHLEADLAGHRGAVSGRLEVAAFATAARGLLPRVLCELRSRHPDLVMSLSEQEPREAIPALVRGHLDIAVVQDWSDALLAVPEGLSRRHLLADRFDVALPSDHPLAGRASIAVKELADEDWISWSAGEVCHDWLVRTMRADRVEPRIRHRASEHSTQVALVAARLGTALLPRLGRDPVPPSVVCVPVEPSPVRDIFALWRSSAAARPAIGATLDALERHGATLAASGDARQAG